MTVLSHLFVTITRYRVPAGTPVSFLSDFSFLSDQNRYYCNKIGFFFLSQMCFLSEKTQSAILPLCNQLYKLQYKI